MENDAVEKAGEIEYWNYRVMKRTELSEDVFEIFEVYYNDKDEAIFNTEKPISPLGLNVEELIDDFELMAMALSKPVLDYDTREEIKNG